MFEITEYEENDLQMQELLDQLLEEFLRCHGDDLNGSLIDEDNHQ